MNRQSTNPPAKASVTATLVVDDLARSIEFYRTLGLDIPEDSIYLYEGYAVHVKVHVNDSFDLDIDSRAATSQWAPHWEAPAGGARGILNFHVPSRDEVDSLHARMLAAGYDDNVTPFDAFWGARYAVVNDPDGNPIGMMAADD